MKNSRTVKLTGVLLLGVMLASACTQTYSQTPLGTPTLIPTGLFVSPFPSGQDPLQIIANIASETASAQTAQAGGTVVATVGTPGTPSTVVAGTTIGTVVGGASATPQVTSAATLLAVTVIPGGSTFTPTVSGASTSTGSTVVAPTFSGTVPAKYTLQKGEWPYCIARRYDVNPDELLTLNGLSVAQSSMLMPGLVLSMPQNGDPFPSDRAWHSHPDSFTVDSSDTTINGVACYYGDLDPQSIATANSLSVNSVLTTGQVLKIP